LAPTRPLIRPRGFRRRQDKNALTSISATGISVSDMRARELSLSAAVLDLMPLTPAVFCIMLALSSGPKHGYAVMQETSTLSEGGFKMVQPLCIRHSETCRAVSDCRNGRRAGRGLPSPLLRADGDGPATAGNRGAAHEFCRENATPVWFRDGQRVRKCQRLFGIFSGATGRRFGFIPLNFAAAYGTEMADVFEEI